LNFEETGLSLNENKTNLEHKNGIPPLAQTREIQLVQKYLDLDTYD